MILLLFSQNRRTLCWWCIFPLGRSGFPFLQFGHLLLACELLAHGLLKQVSESLALFTVGLQLHVELIVDAHLRALLQVFDLLGRLLVLASQVSHLFLETQDQGVLLQFAAEVRVREPLWRGTVHVVWEL